MIFQFLVHYPPFIRYFAFCASNWIEFVFQVSALFKEYGISKFSVQVEKEAFFYHMSALSAGYKSVLALKQGADMGLSSVAGEFDYGLIKAV